MLSRLHKKNHPNKLVERTLRVRANKIALLQSLDLYDPAKDYYSPKHPRNLSKNHGFFGKYSSPTGRMLGKNYAQQTLLTHFRKLGVPNKMLDNYSLHDSKIDWTALENMAQNIASKDTNQMIAPTPQSGMSQWFIDDIVGSALNHEK